MRMTTRKRVVIFQSDRSKIDGKGQACRARIVCVPNPANETVRGTHEMRALQNWRQNLEKAVDNSVICAKIICDIATRYEKEAAQDTMSEEGTVRAFGGIRCGPLSCGLRDQDGRSRYRAAKIQGISL